MHDLWFMAWQDAAETPALPGLQGWRALDGPGGRAYLDATGQEFAPGPGWQRMVCLQQLAGASAGQRPGRHYVVETEVLPEHEAEFNAWYRQEHLPGLAAVTGTVLAARYRCEATHQPLALPRYHACYHLIDEQVLGCAQWLAVRGTPWGDRVRPMFRHTQRTLFQPQPGPGTALASEQATRAR